MGAKQTSHGSRLTFGNEINRAAKIHTAMVNDLVTQEAKAKLQEMFGGIDSLNDPQEQIVRFFKAIGDGMVPVEAAGYFLHLEPEQYARFVAENPETARLITDFQGRVAQEQYRKLTQDGGPREALEWLRANRADQWRERREVSIPELAKALSKASDAEVLALVAEEDERP